MRIIGALLLSIVLTNCGGVGAASTATCEKVCDKNGSCSGSSAQSIAQCKQSCPSVAIALTFCRNGSAIVSCQESCVSKPTCIEYYACIGSCPSCSSQ